MRGTTVDVPIDWRFTLRSSTSFNGQREWFIHSASEGLPEATGGRNAIDGTSEIVDDRSWEFTDGVSDVGDTFSIVLVRGTELEARLGEVGDFAEEDILEFELRLVTELETVENAIVLGEAAAGEVAEVSAFDRVAFDMNADDMPRPWGLSSMSKDGSQADAFDDLGEPVLVIRDGWNYQYIWDFAVVTPESGASYEFSFSRVVGPLLGFNDIENRSFELFVN